MATVTKGRTFVSGEIITPAKLNDVVDLATVTDIQTADIADGQVTDVKLATGIDANKITTGTLPIARIADGDVVNAKLASGIDASKLTTGTLPIARVADGAVTAAKLDGAQAGSAPIFGARAWVRFVGTAASPTIAAAGNVTSVTKNSTGNYTITFTTAMPDTLYATLVTGRRASPGASLGMIAEGGTYTATQVQIRFVATDSSAVDVDMGTVAIFR
jgi:hypothetical protein